MCVTACDDDSCQVVNGNQLRLHVTSSGTAYAVGWTFGRWANAIHKVEDQQQKERFVIKSDKSGRARTRQMTAEVSRLGTVV